MFINLSNHPSNRWDEKQLNEARKYGEVIDMDFPTISPQLSIHEVQQLAGTFVERIVGMKGESIVVHIMGEMTFTLCVVTALQKAGIPCVASTTERVVTEEPDGRKISQFRFVQFRPYA